MNEKKLHRRFQRFRRKGDVGALAEVFDAVAPELYRVATHVARDLHEAEDLVQATFLAAIEGREGWDESRRLVPWLLGILVRKAAYERRRLSRAVEPGRLAVRDEPEPAEHAEAREFTEALDEALRKLPPLYRDVLALHLREGKDAREIARELGRAPGTVRVQIHRALGMLRKTLPAGLATGAAIAISAPRGLAVVREAVLRAAESAAARVAAGSSAGATATVIGGIAMSTKALVAGAGAMVLGALGWLGWPREERIVAPLDRARVVATRAAAPETFPLPAGEESRTSTPERVALAHPAVEPGTKETKPAVASGWILRGKVASEYAVKVERTAIAARPIPMGNVVWPVDLAVRARPNANGAYEMDVTSLFESPQRGKPLELIVRADHDDCVPLEERLLLDPARREHPPVGSGPWELRADFVLTPCGAVSGQILLSDGEPAAGTPVGLIALDGGKPAEKPVDHGSCYRDGRFRLRAPRSGDFVILGLRDGLVPLTEPVRIELGREIEIAPRRLSKGAHIAGTVRILGQPAPEETRVGGTCDIRGDWFRFGGVNLIWTQGKFCHSDLATRTDGSGRYRIEGLMPGPHRVRPWHVPGEILAGVSSLAVDAPRDDADFDLNFPRLVIRARSEGRAVKDALVLVRLEDPPGGGAWLRTDREGEGSTLVRPESRISIRTELEGYPEVVKDLVSPGPGQTSTVDLELVRFASNLLVELRAPDDRTIREAGFAFFKDDAERTPPNAGAGFSRDGPGGLQPAFVRDARSETGSFVLRDLAPGSYSLMVEAGGPWRSGSAYCVASPVRVELPPGGEARCAVVLALGGRIRITARNGRGDLLAARCLLRDALGSEVPILVVTTQADGSRAAHPQVLGGLGHLGASDLLPNLLPGAYELEVWLEGYRTKRVPVYVEAEKTSVVEVVLE